MDLNDIFMFFEDKEIVIDSECYLHATKSNIDTIKSILTNGITAACFRNSKGHNFNGKHYISLYKNTSGNDDLKSYLKDRPKFIIKDIKPLYAKFNSRKCRKIFIKTRIPLRMSEWQGEYQQYLKIEPSNIVALEYNIFYTLKNISPENDSYVLKEKLLFLKEIILCMKEMNIKLPIYDLSLYREYNKEKILSLNL